MFKWYIFCYIPRVSFYGIVQFFNPLMIKIEIHVIKIYFWGGDAEVWLKFTSINYLLYKSSSSPPHPQKRFEYPFTLRNWLAVNMTAPPKLPSYKSLKNIEDFKWNVRIMLIVQSLLTENEIYRWPLSNALDFLLSKCRSYDCLWEVDQYHVIQSNPMAPFCWLQGIQHWIERHDWIACQQLVQQQWFCTRGFVSLKTDENSSKILTSALLCSGTE